MKTHFNPLSRFLCFCSGVHLKMLDQQCPTEIGKYAGIGCTVLFTGVFAFISGGYALYRIFIRSEYALWYGVIFGLLWGLMIFNLDRYIVMSLRKEGKPLKEFLFALPRIIIAILISIVIAKPLEVKIFEDRISQIILNMKLIESGENKKQIDNIYGLPELKDRLDRSSRKEDSLHQILHSDPPSPDFKQLLESYETAEEKWKELERINNPKINGLQHQINSIYRNEKVPQFDSLGNEIGRVLPPEAQSRANSLALERNRYKKEIENAEEHYTEIGEKIQEARKIFRQETQDQIKAAGVEKSRILTEKEGAESMSNEKKSNAELINDLAYSQNFVTQLEGLDRMAMNDPKTSKKILFITLLFLAVELAPVLLKLMTKKGAYDDALSTSQELELAQHIEENNRAFAITQANQEALVEIKSALLKQAMEKFAEFKSEELAELPREELMNFIQEVNEFEVEQKD